MHLTWIVYYIYYLSINYSVDDVLINISQFESFIRVDSITDDILKLMLLVKYNFNRQVNRKKRINEFCEALDKDKDGVLNLVDFRKLINKINVNITPEDSNKLVAAIDWDKSGNIEYKYRPL